MGLEWSHDVPISPLLTSEEWTAIHHFRWRATELLKNIEDLSLPNLHIGDHRMHYVQHEIVHIGSYESNIWPGRYRAKSLFLDLRPLLLQKGSDGLGNFYRTRNIILKHSRECSVLQEFLGYVKNGFLSSRYELSVDKDLPSELRSYDAGELLDIWFNTQYFHSGKLDQVRKRREISSVFSADGIEQLLFSAAVGCSHYLQCLLGVLLYSEPSNLYFSHPPSVLVFDRQSPSDEEE